MKRIKNGLYIFLTDSKFTKRIKCKNIKIIGNIATSEIHGPETHNA
ncbi:hypothetical protein [Leptospira sp. 'Mane']